MFEGNKKYNQILVTARDLFWKHGFRRVSIEEVCEKAAVSKMTFYRFFANKIELAKSVYDREMRLGLQKFRGILKEPSTPQEKVRKMVELELEGSHNLSREFLQDFYGDKQLGLREFVETRSREAWSEIIGDFRRAQVEGVFRSDINPEFLLLFSQKMAEVFADERFLNLYDSPQGLVMEVTNLVSYGISPREVEQSPNVSKQKQ